MSSQFFANGRRQGIVGTTLVVLGLAVTPLFAEEDTLDPTGAALETIFSPDRIPANRSMGRWTARCGHSASPR